MYLVSVQVPHEREKRLHECETQKEAVEYIRKLKEYVKIRYKEEVTAKIFMLGEPIEVFT